MRVSIRWPGGRISDASAGDPWLKAASEAGFLVPTGCLGGSCGACEIDVNGATVRACIAAVPFDTTGELTVELATDPHW